MPSGFSDSQGDGAGENVYKGGEFHGYPHEWIRGAFRSGTTHCGSRSGAGYYHTVGPPGQSGSSEYSGRIDPAGNHMLYSKTATLEARRYARAFLDRHLAPR
jgi:hypothetical protein